MRHKIIPAIISVGLLLGLTACATDDAGPANLAAAQTVVSKNFATWVKQVPQADTLRVTNHSGRTATGAQCQGGKVQLDDATAVYVTKTFDADNFLNTFKTYLTKQKIAATRGHDTQSHPVLSFTQNNYEYQLISISTVKIAKLDTNKALLFSVTSPCTSPK